MTDGLETGSDLRALFEPRSIAIIGASADPSSISARPLRMLRQLGYGGAIYPVNPKYAELQGLRVYASVADTPEPADLALVIVPARVVLSVLEECAAAGVRVAMVITSGFAERGGSGSDLQADIAKLVSRTRLRVCGPNSEGLYNPAAQMCATFSPAVDPEHGFVPSPAGPIAIVSQSGGIAFALMNHARDRGLSVGAVVSTGNEVDVGWADYVDYVLDDPTCRVVLGFVESFRQPDALVAVARKAARLGKPLIVNKIGRSDAGRRAAVSHTGSVVGSDATYSAIFDQLGILRVDDVDEMCDLAAYFSVGRIPTGPRVAVLTASGGAGAWLADACAMRGLELPTPESDVQARLAEFVPEYGSVKNPIDITAQVVMAGGFERALEYLVQSDAFDTLAAVVTLVREDRFFQTLPELRAAIDGYRGAVVYYSYTRATPRIVAALSELGIPYFPTPARTARALSAAVSYGAFIRRLANVRALSGPIVAGPPWPSVRGSLSEVQSRAFLEPLGIPSPAEVLVGSAEEAVQAFAALGAQPVAVKVQSADVPHKSDRGGVILNVEAPEDVWIAYTAVVDAAHGAPVEGVLIQAMAPPGGLEMLVAARREPLVGPLVIVGVGGLEVEAQSDVAMRLAPVNAAEAEAMVEGLRSAARLAGSRGRRPLDVQALARTIVAISELAVNLPPGVDTVEINPLLVLPDGDGVLMLDASVEVGRVCS